ncbi:MAG TPA: hypothetical protein VE359_04520 [Vicinamibacteria bacterium]|nr:hypothetical protein [Vicinamibacteria bacterium]
MGLVHRVVEEATGIAGVSLTDLRGVAEAVKPSRSVFLPHPPGATFGRPGHRELQKRILMEALEFAASDAPAGAVLDSAIRYD